jgi:hypothetical protein
MVYYKRRSWKNLQSQVYIGEEGNFVSIMDMDEKEFREFILWRLGLAMPSSGVAEMKRVIEGYYGKSNKTPQSRRAHA